MKYRMLTTEELQVFEEDLKQFLIVNGVHSEEWEEMNKSNVEQATKLVELFSDSVLQKVYEKINFVEHRSVESCMVFKFDEEAMQLISINAKEQGVVDLSTPESIHESLTKKPNNLTIFKSQKPYDKEREEEVHEMIEQGCFISTEEFWKLLEEVLD
ncbi:MAG: DUF6495 family protein [Crocinitomicaceae bacterium]|nr:DUF6495 family protein [Crocinitomicaceae bacterium]